MSDNRDYHWYEKDSNNLELLTKFKRNMSRYFRNFDETHFANNFQDWTPGSFRLFCNIERTEGLRGDRGPQRGQRDAARSQRAVEGTEVHRGDRGP